MSKVILAICEKNKRHCQRLTEYFRNHLRLSFEIHSFTDTGYLLDFAKKQEIALLVISESSYADIEPVKNEAMIKNMIVLDEEKGETKKDAADGEADSDRVRHISKYIPASEIVGAVVRLCTEKTQEFTGLTLGTHKGSCRVYGFFTPISRCGQSRLAIRMGEKLAESQKTILLSFESFSALGSMFEGESEEDISDLLYYADCERDKFCLYLERIKMSRKGLDYIPPAKTALQLKEIGRKNLTDLIELLTNLGGYECILLDLKEYPDDFFEILSMCDVVFTAVRNNSSDHYRIGKYNQVLSQSGYESVITKTIKCTLPDMRDVISYNSYLEMLLMEGQEIYDAGA